MAGGLRSREYIFFTKNPKQLDTGFGQFDAHDQPVARRMVVRYIVVTSWQEPGAEHPLQASLRNMAGAERMFPSAPGPAVDSGFPTAPGAEQLFPPNGFTADAPSFSAPGRAVPPTVPPPRLIAPLGFPPPGACYVACADGGYAFAAAEGIVPDIVIGDFDSLAPEFLREMEEKGIKAQRHPREKDDTDTMLCVKHGLALGFSAFTLVGGLGGEFSHTAANLQALSFLTDMECDAEIVTPRERVLMIDGLTVKAGRPGDPDPLGPGADAARREQTVCGRAGQYFSVFSYAERTSRVCIEGDAKYLLKDAVLTQSYPIGARNEFAEAGDGGAPEVRIKAGFGRLLVVIEN
jgi:thiamine pyrophosphokinase